MRTVLENPSKSLISPHLQANASYAYEKYTRFVWVKINLRHFWVIFAHCVEKPQKNSRRHRICNSVLLLTHDEGLCHPILRHNAHLICKNNKERLPQKSTTDRITGCMMRQDELAKIYFISLHRKRKIIPENGE